MEGIMSFPFIPQAVRARLCLTMAMVIVGSSVVVGTYVTSALPVALSLWLRFVLASAVMVPLLVMREGGLPRLAFREWAMLFLQAACGGYLFNTLLLKGLAYTDPITAGILTATGPACVLLVSCVLLGERLTGRAVIAVCLAVVGIGILQQHSPEGVSGSEGVVGWAGGAMAQLLGPSFAMFLGGVWGTVLILGAVVAEALFLLLGKRLQTPLSSFAASTMLCVFGAVQFTPQAIPELLSHQIAVFDLLGWLVIVWYALGITVTAYLLWFSGVASVSGAEAGVYTGVMPLSAMGLSAVILGTDIHWAHVAGVTAVLLGIVVASGSRRGREIVVQKENAIIG